MTQDITNQQIRDLMVEVSDARNYKLLIACEAALHNAPISREQCKKAIEMADAVVEHFKSICIGEHNEH